MLQNKLSIGQYEILNNTLNEYLAKKGLNTNTTNIFEHAILRLGRIAEVPKTCRFGRNEFNPDYFFIDLDLPESTIKTLVENLNTLAAGMCEYLPKYNRNGLRATRFSVAKLSTLMPAIQQCIDEILSEKNNLMAYQRYANKQPPLYETVVKEFVRITKPFHISLEHTDCAEMVIATMFNCNTEVKAAGFGFASGYVEQMVDTNFYFDIPENAARHLVDNINEQFPAQTNPARFVNSNLHLDANCPINFCAIAIDSTLLCSESFLKLFQDTLQAISENNPLLLEKFRRQSGTQKKSSEEYATDITAIAQHYQNAEESKTENNSTPRHRLANALCNFSAIIKNPRSKTSDRVKESEKVRGAMAFFESTQTIEENKQFNEGDKQTITNVQKSLGLNS